MKTQRHNQVRHGAAAIILLISFLLFLPMNVQAHNLDTRAISISFAQDFLELMSQRAENDEAPIQVGDELWMIMKTTPGPGTNTGVGGRWNSRYMFFHIDARRS